MAGRFKIVIDTPNALWDFDKRKLKAVMRQAGAEVSNLAKALMRSSGGGRTYRGSGGTSRGFRPYKRGSYSASQAGQAPASVTKTLIRSIKVLPFRSGIGVAIRATAFYDLFLEAGAQGGIGSGGRTKAQKAAGLRMTGQSNRRDHHTGQRFQVVGSRVVAPRPSLSLALDQKQASLGSRIAAAVQDGIKFQKVK